MILNKYLSNTNAKANQSINLKNDTINLTKGRGQSSNSHRGGASQRAASNRSNRHDLKYRTNDYPSYEPDKYTADDSVGTRTKSGMHNSTVRDYKERSGDRSDRSDGSKFKNN